MANYNRDWENLGRNVQDIIDRAVKSQDYQKLNQTIRQTVDRAMDLGGEAVRKAADASRSTSRTYVCREQKVVVEKKNLPVLYGNTNKQTAKGIVKIVGGSVVSGFSLLLAIGASVLAFAEGMLMPVGLALAALGGGIGLIGSGVGSLNRVGRFKAYRKALGAKPYCTLEKLARSVGKTEKFVRREVQKMINGGLFLEGHLDKEETMLITSDETYRNFEQNRLALEARQKQEAAMKAQAEKLRQAAPKLDPQVQEILDKGDAFVAQIQKCNDDIPGAMISEKISRIERTVQHIFDRAEEHPEVIPDLKKMMDYYLPMTVKLLNAYADMDAQPVQGETILASKREIEETLDTLNLAFEKLLDSIFKDTALDVSSDISVLNTLLAQEGLTDDDFTKLKKENHYGR